MKRILFIIGLIRYSIVLILVSVGIVLIYFFPNKVSTDAEMTYVAITSALLIAIMILIYIVIKSSKLIFGRKMLSKYISHMIELGGNNIAVLFIELIESKIYIKEKWTKPSCLCAIAHDIYFFDLIDRLNWSKLKTWIYNSRPITFYVWPDGGLSSYWFAPNDMKSRIEYLESIIESKS